MRPRRLRSPLPQPAVVGASDEERIVWLLIGEAQAQIALSTGRTDGQEVKALGILGLDAAVIAALTAARSERNHGHPPHGRQRPSGRISRQCSQRMSGATRSTRACAC